VQSGRVRVLAPGASSMGGRLESVKDDGPRRLQCRDEDGGRVEAARLGRAEDRGNDLPGSGGGESVGRRGGHPSARFPDPVQEGKASVPPCLCGYVIRRRADQRKADPLNNYAGSR